MNASRRIAILEAVLILLPLTILAALGTLWSGPYLAVAIADLRFDLLTLVSALGPAGLLGLIAGWWLLIRFIRQGQAGLRAPSRLPWIGAALGAITAIAGAALALSGQGLIFAAGLPALIPLAHLWRERGRAYD
jgi:hypothetical protein